MEQTTRRRIFQVAIIVVLLGFTILVALNLDKLEVSRFRALGYPGVFLMAMVGSSTVVLPIPHLAFTFTMGAVLNPWLAGIVAGIGDALGELTGYLAGYALEDVVDKYRLYKRLEGWMIQRGDATIFVLSLLPVPFFDLAAMAGGLTGYPLHRFMLMTWAGKTIKALVAAWAGHYGIAWMAQLLQVESP